jgi:hypothetical protein
MTTYDMICSFSVLIAMLMGIGVGVHLAYTMVQSEIARGSNKSDNDKKKTTGEFKFHQFKEKVTDIFTKPDDDSETVSGNNLQSHMLNHDRMSFSEFDSQFNNEDFTERLIQSMQQQEQAYNYLYEQERMNNQQ